MSTLRRAAVVVIFLMAVVGLAPTASAAQKTYQYSFTNHGETDNFTDIGLCSDGPADITITYNEALHVSATEPNLSQDDIEALLEQDNSGVITKVTYTQTGKFVVVEDTGVTYRGRFTSWFGGSLNSNTTVFTGIFTVSGTGSDGSRITGSNVGHVTFVNGDEVVNFGDEGKGHIKGCLTV